MATSAARPYTAGAKLYTAPIGTVVGNRFMASSSSGGSSNTPQIRLSDIYNPGGGTPTQLNAGDGRIVYPDGNNGTTKGTTNPYAPVLAAAAKSGINVGKQVLPNGARIMMASSSSGSAPSALGKANEAYLKQLLAKNGSGPLNYTTKKTLSNIQEAIGFNSSITDMIDAINGTSGGSSLGEMLGGRAAQVPFNPTGLSKQQLASTPEGRSYLKDIKDKKDLAINSRLAAVATPLPPWMAANARRDVQGGFDLVTALTNAGSGGLINPITGRAADGLRENASLTDYLNRQNALYTEMNGGVSYAALQNAYKKSIGLA